MKHVCIKYLNPRVGCAQFFHKLRPLVNHLDNLLFFHERESDVRPGVETHDLTEKVRTKREEGRKTSIKSFKTFNLIQRKNN